MLGYPAGQGVVVGYQVIAPQLGAVQGQRVGGAAVAGGVYSGADRLGLYLAHQLADVLHLAATAFKVGNAFHLGHSVHQLLGQVQLGDLGGGQDQQLLA